MGAGYRQFTADTQYQGVILSQPVTRLNTMVISKTKAMELSGTYAINQQLNVTAGVPLILRASSNRALPATVAGSPRFEHSTAGIGDTMVTARYWIMNCENNPTQNISFGFGLKMPTGESNATDEFPNALGQDVRLRPVDQSIQLGDGGWGFTANIEAFRQFGYITAFGTMIYLFNPKGQNDTLSPPALLNPVSPQAVPLVQRFNTVSDSYLLRIGIGAPVPRLPGFSLSLAGRIEGVPVTDVFGDTAGFRRPGYYVALEPGINFSYGRGTYAISVPVGLQENVQPSLGFARDSTFASHIILLSATYRFGGSQ